MKFSNKFYQHWKNLCLLLLTFPLGFSGFFLSLCNFSFLLFHLFLPRVTLESASKIKMHQNLFKLTSIGMSNLKAVCWTNTYQFLLCSCLTWRQVALCESFLNLHLQRVAIHNCHVLLTSLSQGYLYFLPLFKRTKMQILVAPCLLIPPTHELWGDSSV